jgi:hypothetical protein
MAGFGVGGPVGAAIGGGVGLIAGLRDSSDPEKERRKRVEEVRNYLAYLRDENKRQKQQALLDSATRLGKFGGGMVSQARGTAAERMAALGRTSDAEPAIASATQQAATEANRLIGESAFNLSRQYDDRDLVLAMEGLNVERDFADRPIQPGVGDFLLGVGEPLFQYGVNRELLAGLRETAPMGETEKLSIGGRADVNAPILGGFSANVPKMGEQFFNTPSTTIQRPSGGTIDFMRLGQIGRRANRTGFGSVRQPSFGFGK